MRAAYTGTEALTFSQYMDLDTGKTLTAEPGGVYDITPASGHVVDDVPEPWFTAAEPKAIEAGPAADDEPQLDFTPGPDLEEPEG